MTALLQLAAPTTIPITGKEPVPSRDAAVVLNRARLEDWLDWKLINKKAYVKLGILLFLAKNSGQSNLVIDPAQIIAYLETEITKIGVKDVKMALLELELTEDLEFGGLTFESRSTHVISEINLQLDLFLPNQQETDDDSVHSYL